MQSHHTPQGLNQRNFNRYFSLILSRIQQYSMDSVKIKLTLLIDLYGALFKWGNVGKQLLNLSP